MFYEVFYHLILVRRYKQSHWISKKT